MLNDLLNPDYLVENAFLFSILSIFLGMYGPHLHMKLPPTIKGLFNNPMFRMAVLFLIAFMANRDFTAALTVTIIFVVTLNLVQSSNVLEEVTKQLEGFSANGAPVANCRGYNMTNINTTGTVHYPLNDDNNELSNNDLGGNRPGEYSSEIDFGLYNGVGQTKESVMSNPPSNAPLKIN
jgi:hypothetical protein